MTNSNPFLIHEQKGTDIQNPIPSQWVFTLKKDGILKADFLLPDGIALQIFYYCAVLF